MPSSSKLLQLLQCFTTTFYTTIPSITQLWTNKNDFYFFKTAVNQCAGLFKVENISTRLRLGMLISHSIYRGCTFLSTQERDFYNTKNANPLAWILIFSCFFELSQSSFMFASIRCWNWFLWLCHVRYFEFFEKLPYYLLYHRPNHVACACLVNLPSKTWFSYFSVSSILSSSSELSGWSAGIWAIVKHKNVR